MDTQNYIQFYMRIKKKLPRILLKSIAPGLTFEFKIV